MIFSISGYWKDDQSEFDGYLVKVGGMGEDDEKIFFYFEEEDEIKQMVEDGLETGEDFVITSYEKYI